MGAQSRGTSPRVWGKLHPAAHPSDARRNIPTRVGKTFRRGLSWRAPTEHPHACGENEIGIETRSYIDGTSPRVWGKPGVRRPCGVEPRNIPTRVGKTRTASRSPSRATEHPHACGENFGAAATRARKRGTSPRVWGKPNKSNSGLIADRNIPTRVGKTHFSRPSSYKTTEHPHACGENAMISAEHPFVTGTSPRVWGKLEDFYWPQFAGRNIPTRVGKTLGHFLPYEQVPEHPHACGENP